MQSLTQNWKRTLGLLIGTAVVLFVLIQFIPVDKTNPAVAQEPNWDSPHTRDLAKAACFDCHSNETKWPWYANIAPSSWLLSRDVSEGRSTLNFSEWGSGGRELDEIAEVINEGEMPPWYYRLMHSDAKLSDSDKQDLITGLEATFAQSGNGSGAEVNSGDSDDE
jgi:mono/diheme cytochrome c family protein